MSKFMDSLTVRVDDIIKKKKANPVVQAQKTTPRVVRTPITRIPIAPAAKSGFYDQLFSNAEKSKQKYNEQLKNTFTTKKPSYQSPTDPGVATMMNLERDDLLPSFIRDNLGAKAIAKKTIDFPSKFTYEESFENPSVTEQGLASLRQTWSDFVADPSFGKGTGAITQTGIVLGATPIGTLFDKMSNVPIVGNIIDSANQLIEETSPTVDSVFDQVSEDTPGMKDMNDYFFKPVYKTLLSVAIYGGLFEGAGAGRNKIIFKETEIPVEAIRNVAKGNKPKTFNEKLAVEYLKWVKSKSGLEPSEVVKFMKGDKSVIISTRKSLLKDITADVNVKWTEMTGKPIPEPVKTLLASNEKVALSVQNKITDYYNAFKENKLVGLAGLGKPGQQGLTESAPLPSDRGAMQEVPKVHQVPKKDELELDIDRGAENTQLEKVNIVPAQADLEYKIQTAKDNIAEFNDSKIVTLNRVGERLQKADMQDGDIETAKKILKEERKIATDQEDIKALNKIVNLEEAIETVQEASGLEMSDDQAFEKLRDEILPSIKEIKKMQNKLKKLQRDAYEDTDKKKSLPKSKNITISERAAVKRLIKGEIKAARIAEKSGKEMEKVKQTAIQREAGEKAKRKTELSDLKKLIKDKYNPNTVDKVLNKKISDTKIKQADTDAIRNGIIRYAKKHLKGEDRGKVLSLVNRKKLNDQNLLDAMDVIDSIEEKVLKAGIWNQINKELKTIKPVMKGSRTVSKYDYETNKFLQQLKNISKYTQVQAQAELANVKTENLTHADLIKNRMLSLKANGVKSSLALQAQVLADIQDLKDIGKEAKDEADFQKGLEKQGKKDEILEGIKGQKKSIAGLKQLKSAYISSVANLYSTLNTIAGKEIADKYDYGMYQTNSKQDAFVKTEEFKDKAKDIYGVKKDSHLTKLFIEDLAKMDYKIIDVDGSEDINKFDLMNIYNGMKNDLIKERYYNAFGKEQIDALLQNLIPEDIKLADYLMKEVQSYKDILNKRSIETRGLDNGTVENYWPSSSEHEQEFFDEIRVQGETPGAMKERSVSSKVIPKMANAWLIAQKHVAEAEHMKTVSKKYEELRNLFSDRAIRRSIEAKYGEDAYRSLIKDIDTFSLNYRMEGLDLISKWYDKALNNWVRAKVASPTVFARQMISSVYSVEKVGIKNFTKYQAELVKNPRKAFKYMWDNVPFIKNRFKQGYSEALEDVIRGTKNLDVGMDTITKYTTLMTRGGDVTAIMLNGYPIIKSEMAKHGDMDKAIEEFQKFSEKTQQSPSKANISDPQRNMDVFHKMFFRFKNTTNQLLRLQVDANIQFMNDQISAKNYAAKTFLYSVYTPFMYVLVGYAVKEGWKSLWRALLGKEDEEEEENTLAGDILQNAVVQPFQAIPLLDMAAEATYKKIREKVTGKEYRYGMFSFPLLDDVERAWQKTFKEDPSAMDWLEVVSLLQEPTIGIPTGTALRYYDYAAGGEKKNPLEKKLNNKIDSKLDEKLDEKLEDKLNKKLEDKLKSKK